ncbi:MAG: ABC transporter ATP-binding protein [Candidatus Aminicenantes bacterium]|nr:ABC transporter ATP-binding protein [Candidatus Aminicenantes bacterium]
MPSPTMIDDPVRPVVEVRGLVKDFGKFRAVDDVSFDVHRGEILGLLGPNGAGKTTVIHMLLGLTTPTAGTIRIFGFDLAHHREEILERTNFSSTYVSLPYSLTVRECLRVFAGLYHVRRPKARIEELLETFEMPDLSKKQVRHLSTGQMSRLNLAKAFINEPELLLLDEPTASLDPDIADKTRSLLVQVAEQRNVSILYTSHNMLEMEEISDRLVFLHKGKVIAAGKPEDVVSTFEGQDLEDVFLKIAREKRP